MSGLARGYWADRKLDIALPLMEETLRLRTATLGADARDTLTSMSDLGVGYRATGQLGKALPLLAEALRLRKVKLGADDLDTLTSMNNLAAAYWADKQFDKALPLLEEVLRRFRVKLGPEHSDTLTGTANLAVLYCEVKRSENAVPLFAEFFERRRRQAKPNDRAFVDELADAAQKLMKCQRFPEAESYLREGLAICEKAQPDDWTTFNARFILGTALLAQKKYADAEPLLLEGYEGMKKREG
jgi:tetratricopeptide (TPR) repeat protein